MNPFQPTEVCIPDEGILERFETRVAFQTSEGGWVPTWSFRLVCPLCGQPWSQLLREDDRKVVYPYAAICRACPPHEDFAPPGSLLIPWGFRLIDHELLEALPLRLLQREFQLHERLTLETP